MFKSALKLFLSPRGRIGRKTFIFCFFGWLAFYIAQALWFSKTGNNLFNFYLALLLLFVNIQIIFSIYGKRLHDFGRSIRPIIALFVIIILTWIVLMLNFGGLEYFDTVYQNPEIVEDEAAMQKVTEAYQSAIKLRVPQTRLILGSIAALFTIWVASRPGDPSPNPYGDPIKP